MGSSILFLLAAIVLAVLASQILFVLVLALKALWDAVFSRRRK